MATDQVSVKLASRLDKLYEFERAPVTPDKHHSGRYFAGLFAGEHVAATEFVIGVLFVQWGVTAGDLIWGLIIGNLLAVLSWAFICAPIAVRTRLTLYWYVRRIIGPGLTVIYNFVNAVLYCCLAAAMIGVSASAVFVACSKFGHHLEHPELDDILPNSFAWVAVVLIVGSVVVFLAIAGFKKLSQFASLCSPWMFMIFIAGALASLPQLGQIQSIRDLGKLAETRIWTGQPYESAKRAVDSALPRTAQPVPVPQTLRDELGEPDRNWVEARFKPRQILLSDSATISEVVPGQRWIINDNDNEYIIKNVEVVDRDGSAQIVRKVHVTLDRYGFWHVLFFAWFCNLAMHVGLSDMAVFRYAKKWTYGFYSAFGMYLGHFVAWICAGVMGAVIGQGLEPGLMADKAVGWAGILAVLIAGWTTANPTIYRAGLALQIITPNWPRWSVTLAAGAITTVVGFFPAIFMQLLDFVAIYGLMLMPIGAVIVAEHWFFPKLGLRQYWTDKRKLALNVPALISWLLVLGLCFPFEAFFGFDSPMQKLGVHLFFRWLPGWFIAAGTYTLICLLAAGILGTRATPDDVLEAQAAPPSKGAPAQAAAAGPPPSAGPVAWIAGAIALLALVTCLLFPLMVFLGGSESQTLARNLELYKTRMIYATVIYFVAAIVYMVQRERVRSAGA